MTEGLGVDDILLDALRDVPKERRKETMYYLAMIGLSTYIEKQNNQSIDVPTLRLMYGKI